MPRSPLPSATSADKSAPDSARRTVAELDQTVVKPFSLVGVTWSSGLKDDAVVDVKYRVKGVWSTWSKLELDLANTAIEGGRPGTESQWVGTADGVAVRVTASGNQTPVGLRVATINPGKSTSMTPVAFQPAAGLRTAATQPGIIMRSSWGANNSGTCDSPVYGPKTLGAVIHHTAGSNSYSKSESAGIVRATQAYHMDSRDWCDIGYNFLVDKYGQIFEGRKGGITQAVRAAHSGNGDVNEETIGVSMMGTFSSTTPSTEMKAAVVNLVGWRFSLAAIPAKGTYSLGGLTLNRIAGHRNVVSTECPGQKAYDWLSASDGLRDRVATYLENNGSSDTSAPTGLASTASTPTSLTFNWNAVEGAPQYRIQLSTSSSMSAATYYRFVPTTGTVTGLKPNTTYYAKVRTIDMDGVNISDYSPSISIKTPAAPPSGTDVPTGLSVTASTTTSIKYGWNAVEGAPQYRIQLSTSSSMSSATYYRFVDTSGTITGLKAGQKYYAKVRTIEMDGTNISAYSPAISFTTPKTAGKKTDTPKGLALTGRTGSSLTFGWNPVTDAPRYRIQLSTSSSMSNATYYRFYGTTGTITGLKAAQKYYAKVRTIEDDGTNLSSYSSAVSATTLAVEPVSSGSTSTNVSVPVPASSAYTLKGHGYGHGIGMSQYGAEGAARDGKSASSILATYYPGTDQTKKTGNIRVLLSADTTDSVMVEGREGLTLRYVSSGKTLSLPSTIDGKKVIRWSIDPLSSDKKKSVLRYRTTSTWATFKATTWTGDAQFEASTLDLVMPSDANRTYRTALRSSLPKSGATNRDTVNVLSIENYTRGVVAREMPSSWHAQALQAQSVAARTYGVRAITSSRYYDICDTTSCQVYGGADAETTSTDAAVKATAETILTYKGSPAFTQFSSSSGGYTAVGSQPYLKAVVDSTDGWSGNANHSWTQTVKASAIQAKYPTIGTLKSMKVTKRNGFGDYDGRVTTLELVGSKGTKTITGDQARTAFGLKSNWFTF